MLPTIETGTIHLLRAALDPPPVALPVLERLLSPEERARADRFRFEPLRRRHVASRGLLRIVLGRVLGQPPETLRFERMPGGKPVLAGGSASGPSFNLSHSGDQLVIGLAREGRLGVDLEMRRSVPDLEALATRFLAAEEVEELFALPSADRPAAFLRGWTRKEAFVKAVGGGLSIPLTSFAVGLSPGGGNALRRADDFEGPWWVSSVSDEGGEGKGGPAGESKPDGVEMGVAWDRGEPRILRSEIGPEFSFHGPGDGRMIDR